ncbi:MAG: hypothetical protein QM813_22705 [Verrucomicrobiota bacterium]
MKIIATLIIACSIFSAHAAEDKPGVDTVVVGVLDLPFPTKEEEKFTFLWEKTGFKSNAKFDSYTTENWEDNFAAFSKSLVRKAESQKLDAASLNKALDEVLSDSKGKIAYLPIGAHQAKIDEGLVWIITVKWEYPLAAPNHKQALGHIRKFVFNQKTLERVGFVTCN